MREYIIASPPYAHNCGGIVVLHRLGHLLNERGYKAYNTGFVLNPAWNEISVNTLSQEKLRDLQHNGIIVYPDIVPYNPCKFTNVVKWWLGATQPERPNQLTFAFCEKHQEIYKYDHNLFVWYIDENIFKLPISEERHNSCVYSGKGQGMFIKPVPETGHYNSPTPGCTLITGGFPSTRQGVAELFQRSEVFYCYDNMTIMPTEARLCGCPVIMVGYNVFSKESFEKDEFSMYGMGMYNDTPDIKKLKEEIPLFLENYQLRKEKTEKELDNFIEETQKWNPNNIYVEDVDPTGQYLPMIFGHKNFSLFNNR